MLRILQQTASYPRLIALQCVRALVVCTIERSLVASDAKYLKGLKMSETRLRQWRIYLVILVVLAELAHLAWEHFHGGVLSHNILNRRDLPAISNGWGLLLLPALAWFLGGLSLQRLASNSAAAPIDGKPVQRLSAGFIGSLIFGMALAGSFASGRENVTLILFQSIFVLSLLLPLYRPECWLGFVLGMTFTFGAVLPTAVGLIFFTLSALFHRLVYPLLLCGWAKLSASIRAR